MHWLLLFALLPFIGCVDEIGVEELFPLPPSNTPGNSRDEVLCVEDGHPSMLTRCGAISVDSLWLFDEVILNEPNSRGIQFVECPAAIVDNPINCGDGFHYLTDEHGDLIDLLPLTDEERQHNDTSTTWQYRRWLAGAIRYEDVYYIFFNRIQFYDYFYFYAFSTGIIALSATPNLERLWQRDEIPNTYFSELQLGLVDGLDGHIYIYTSVQQSQHGNAVYIHRFEADELQTGNLDIKFFNGGDWVDDRWEAVPVIDHGGEVSVAYNSFQGKFVAVYAQPLSNTVNIRSAPHPAGPWNSCYYIFQAEPPAEWLISRVAQHPFYEENGGGYILISYFSQPAENEPGLHLVRYDAGYMR